MSRVGAGMALAGVLALGLAFPYRRGPRGQCRGVYGCSATALPSYDHIVVILEENKSLAEIVGNPQAPYLNSLAVGGASMTQSFGVATQRAELLAMFSGSTHGLTKDTCPSATPTRTSLTQLSTAGKTFAAYSESLPSPGYTGCKSGH